MGTHMAAWMYDLGADLLPERANATVLSSAHAPAGVSLIECWRQVVCTKIEAKTLSRRLSYSHTAHQPDMPDSSFEFVHLDADDVREKSSSKDPLKRQVVRSHAMRDYRSRQRREHRGT